MRGFEFHRFDLVVTARDVRNAGVRISVTSSGGVRDWMAASSNVHEWYARPPSLAKDLAANFRPSRDWSPESRLGLMVDRVTVDVSSAQLASLPWEETFAHCGWTNQKSVVVRTSPVRARVQSIPLTLPLRILVVDPESPEAITRSILGVFGPDRSSADLEPAICVGECHQTELAGFVRDSNWPTVDVLHFDQFAAVLDETDLLRTSSPDEFPTAGWFLRNAELWQTRLIVLCCTKATDVPLARMLAQTLIRCGGPAVLVTLTADQSFLKSYYSFLIHDNPLDETLTQSNRVDVWTSHRSLFAGGGREELLRVSPIADELLNLATELNSDSEWIKSQFDAFEFEPPSSPATLALLQRMYISMRSRDHQHYLQTLQSVCNSLDSLRQTSQDFEFSLHESDGLLPLSRELAKIRRMIGVTQQPSIELSPLSGFLPISSTIDLKSFLRGDATRFVNSRLCHEASPGRITTLAQNTSPLAIGQIYHLGLQIGPKDREIRIVGAIGLLEEVFKWREDQDGTWVEFGVTGIDFDVLGSPVQEVWLPRNGPSETVYIAVVPRRAGVSQLRFCLYFEHAVIQSFRLAALTGELPYPNEDAIRERAYLTWVEAERPAGRDTEFWFRAENSLKIGDALKLSPQDADGVGYLAKLEFAVTDMKSPLLRRSDKTVSIVANDLAGVSVTTLKGPDIFTVETDSNLSTHVNDFRSVLDSIATMKLDEAQANILKRDQDYRFGTSEDRNQGNPIDFEQGLKELAQVGWRLYSNLVGTEDNQRQRLTELLEQGRTIQVAHIFLEKVIPWAGIYDRYYDPGMQEIDGRPATHQVCFACLPDATGNVPSDRCSKHANCLLHPARLQEREDAGLPAISAATVVCPLHFWGFRNQIEVPPHTIEDSSKPIPTQFCKVSNTSRTQIIGGFHKGLAGEAPHAAELETLFTGLGVTGWKREDRRDPLITLLSSADIDLIYLYCHTREKAAATLDHALEIWDGRLDSAGNRVVGRISSSDLDTQPVWNHHPFVILNGCQTVGFTSTAVSPFVKTLVRRRQASGVLGTEVPVWEQLASEVALWFLEEFLTGKSAGESLLTIRRRLLAKLNPLGLLYTLYAYTGLTLERPLARAGGPNSSAGNNAVDDLGKVHLKG